jgi:hypothetical protein
LSHKGVNQQTRHSSSNTNSSNDAETQVPFRFLLSAAGTSYELVGIEAVSPVAIT